MIHCITYAYLYKQKGIPYQGFIINNLQQKFVTEVFVHQFHLMVGKQHEEEYIRILEKLVCFFLKESNCIHIYLV